MKRALIALALMASPAAFAEDAIPPESAYVMPQIPTDAEKVEALKLAYRLNGNSMIGNNRMIDLTDPAVLKADRIVTTVPVIPEPLPKPVDADPDGGIWPKLAEKSDTCARHGMHRVVTGSSWRCRK